MGLRRARWWARAGAPARARPDGRPSGTGGGDRGGQDLRRVTPRGAGQRVRAGGRQQAAVRAAELGGPALRPLEGAADGHSWMGSWCSPVE
eukprot:9337683-Alexandrium_andersonii.AAC.1